MTVRGPAARPEPPKAPATHAGRRGLRRRGHVDLRSPARGVATGASALALAVLAAGCANVGSRTLPPQPLALDRLVVTSTDAGWVLAASEAHAQLLYSVAVARNSAWRLVTPPGVSTRGGLAGAFAGQADALVGVFAHGTLMFSPLALTRDGGRTWVPEVLPGPLVRSPEALSLNRSGLARALLTPVAPAGAATSLSGSGSAPPGVGSASVIASSNWGASWSTLAGFQSLSGTARGAGCTLAALTGVEVWTSGATTVLGSCRSPGRAVLLTQGRPGGTWRAGALVPPGGRRGAAVLPLWVAESAGASQAGGTAGARGSGAGRSGAGGSGAGRSGAAGPGAVGGGRTPGGLTVALLVSDRRGAAVIVGTQGATATAGGTWAWSTLLPLGPHASAPEVGVSPQGTWWVLPAPGTAGRQLAVLTTGGAWSAVALPGGAVEAAGLAAGGVALSVVVRARRFTIFTRDPGPHRSWTARSEVTLVS